MCGNFVFCFVYCALNKNYAKFAISKIPVKRSLVTYFPNWYRVLIINIPLVKLNANCDPGNCHFSMLMLKCHTRKQFETFMVTKTGEKDCCI